MNRNSYVTAALFVVFVLLTVVYFNLDTPDPATGLDGVVSFTDTSLSVGDLIQSVSDDAEDEVETDEQDSEIGQQNQDNAAPGQQGQALEGNEGGNAEGNQNEGGNAEGGNRPELGAGSDMTGIETTQAVAALRHSLERAHSEAVSNLQGIIASADHDAETKSDAMDQMNNLTALASNRQILETAIRNMGFSDVLVVANEDAQSVVVHV